MGYSEPNNALFWSHTPLFIAFRSILWIPPVNLTSLLKNLRVVYPTLLVYWSQF